MTPSGPQVLSAEPKETLTEIFTSKVMVSFKSQLVSHPQLIDIICHDKAKVSLLQILNPKCQTYNPDRVLASM